MTELKEKKVEDIKKEADEGIKCPVSRALYYISGFLSGPMCGKCFPCSMGSYEAKIRLQHIIDGKATEADLLALKRISSEMLEASMCKKGKDTAKFVLDWLATDIFAEHINGICRENECTAMMEYVIVSGKCTMCGACLDVCKDNAIVGEKRKTYKSGYLPFEIRQKRCTRCGECMKVCSEGAVILVGAKKAEPVGV